MSYPGILSKELIIKHTKYFLIFFSIALFAFSDLLAFGLYRKEELILGFLFFVSGMQSLFFDYRKNANPSNIQVLPNDFPKYLDYLEKFFPAITTIWGLGVFLLQLKDSL